MAKKDTVAAAQPKDASGPVPTGPQSHTWTTPDEYAAQIALPVHKVRQNHFVQDDEGISRYATLCGKVLGIDPVVRVTDIASDVTCTSCKRRKG